MRFSHIVVSLPLLLCATQFTKPFSMAQAAPMEASEATKLLAKSQSIDSKCKVLASDKAQDLKDFVARAEISLAEKVSVAVARKSIAEGRAQGKATACDAAASKLVNDVLAAANAAVLEPVAEATVVEPKQPKQQQDSVALVEPKEPAVKAAPLQPPKQAALIKPAKLKPVAKATKVEKPAKVKQSLGSYASIAEKYFIARRCRNVSGPEIGNLYKTVLASHKQALAANRPSEVKAMLRTVETRAEGKSCG
jgi:hypothetical protein